MALANTEIVHEGWLVKSPPTKRIWRAVSLMDALFDCCVVMLLFIVLLYSFI